MSIDKLLFAREFVTNLREVGAVLPSSRYLGRASARYSRPAHGYSRPLRILEAGAGTGSFTCEIIPQLEPGDCLDAIELNPTLCALLHERLGSSGLLADPSVEVNLINGNLLTFPLNATYDRIISSLPLTDLPVNFVDHIPGADDGAAETWRRLQLRPIRRIGQDEVHSCQRQRASGDGAEIGCDGEICQAVSVRTHARLAQCAAHLGLLLAETNDHLMSNHGHHFGGTSGKEREADGHHDKRAY